MKMAKTTDGDGEILPIVHRVLQYCFVEPGNGW